MAEAKSKKGVLKIYDAAPKNVRDYFTHFPSLVADYPLDVALSYVFAQVELAHNMTLYCAAVKLHHCETTLTKNAVNTHHMTRQGFSDKFSTVVGKDLPSKISKMLASAEEIRDRVMHGKSVSPADMRNALANVLSYAVAFNQWVADEAGYQPFGSLQGFKGRGQALDRKTTRWVLKGIGFDLQ